MDEKNLDEQLLLSAQHEANLYRDIILETAAFLKQVSISIKDDFDEMPVKNIDDACRIVGDAGQFLEDTVRKISKDKVELGQS